MTIGKKYIIAQFLIEIDKEYIKEEKITISPIIFSNEQLVISKHESAVLRSGISDSCIYFDRVLGLFLFEGIVPELSLTKKSCFAFQGYLLSKYLREALKGVAYLMTPHIERPQKNR
jgi:hypothetical protein